MWILKFKILDKKSPLTQAIIKNNIKIFYYPVNNYIKGKRYYFILTGKIRGKKEGKKNYFKDLKKLKKARTGRRLEFLEIEKDFFIMITSHTITQESRLLVNVAYNPALIHFEPVIWHKDGWEEFRVASTDRENLEKMISVGESKYKFNLLKFKKEKLKNFGFLTMFPELTKKQEEILDIALEKGYYEYPRKISLDKLTKSTKTSFSTIQEHIRKAENKILNFVIRAIKI